MQWRRERVKLRRDIRDFSNASGHPVWCEVAHILADRDTIIFSMLA
jgi:hypothetical protein